jgi:transposase
MQEELARLRAESAQLVAEKAALVEAIQEERDRFRKVIKALLERGSERYKAPVIGEDQLSLFAEQLVAIANAQTPEVEKVVSPSKEKTVKTRPSHPGRRPIPDDIPRLNIELNPEEDLTGCVRIGEEVTEELDYLPGQFFVRRFIRPKYARPEEAGIAIAPAPVRVIDKGIPGPMLLAYILVSKYADHLPLYRQLMIFRRGGIEIDDVTLNGWVKQVLELLKVIYNRIRDGMLESGYLMADESTIRVLDREKEGSTHLGYYWAYMDPVRRSALFVYEKGRGGKYVRDHLKTFSGYIQTDAYAGYDAMPQVNAGITMAGCWAHVRRKFVDAQAVEKEEASWFLGQIQRLYAIERFCRNARLPAEERLEIRTHAKPILEGIKSRMISVSPGLTPRNMLKTAINYTLKQWEELTIYTRVGVLEIDNNLVENSIRPIALGRKNYLFAGNHEAAQRAAVIYTILACCKAHELNPLAYLADVLDKLPARKVNNIDDLLPWHWKLEKNLIDLSKM